jgi:hypothetical protein
MSRRRRVATQAELAQMVLDTPGLVDKLSLAAIETVMPEASVAELSASTEKLLRGIAAEGPRGTAAEQPRSKRERVQAAVPRPRRHST